MTRTTAPSWTEAEDEWLRECYPLYSNAELAALKALKRRLRWEEACERNARPKRPPKSHKIGRPVADGYCYSLSDWEVLEAYQMWDGTYPGAERLAPRYGVSYRTLLRAFKRMEEKWKELQHEHHR